MILVNDTDVVVISLYAFFDLGIDQIWFEYGFGKHRRWVAIHTYVSVLGEEVCRALPFWYVLTGCGTVLSFAEGERRQGGKLGTVFQRLHRTF